MKLYLITDSDDNGDSRDLFVWADDAKEAFGYWRGYYEVTADSVTICEVPMQRERGPVNWAAIKVNQA